MPSCKRIFNGTSSKRFAARYVDNREGWKGRERKRETLAQVRLSRLEEVIEWLIEYFFVDSQEEIDEGMFNLNCRYQEKP